jgi:hypothetical protein
MKHRIVTAAGRVNIEPSIQAGIPCVAVGFTNIPGIPFQILPTLFISPEHAQLLAQAFELAAEEATHLADNAARYQAPPLQAIQGGKGAGS